MKNERTEDNIQYFVTCKYCGTQTQLSLKQFESDKPLKCRKCGAPFKVVPPPKKPPKRRKKIERDYGALMAERYDLDRKFEAERKIVLNVVVFAAAVLIFILVLLIRKC